MYEQTCQATLGMYNWIMYNVAKVTHGWLAGVGMEFRGQSVPDDGDKLQSTNDTQSKYSHFTTKDNINMEQGVA